ncbi:uncharacterized protein BCR38DRAFT_451925 [Pseudomassariella vexata]|uniref:Uncharacterized protein n=1 Tax=Pseudomassariella vexata TaxID=1141098 RepID=A0A1Y2D9K4_9PEZI|nr:uncharacterized protein BCR38DRAFT_451925 [Pseudomassariella vexata]ORY55942.1 hypothetical protein BCR38DRAFT_451925 [Pseudomassariella vexata]
MNTQNEQLATSKEAEQKHTSTAATAEDKNPEEVAEASDPAQAATEPTKPTQLRSHFKGMPNQWEKNKKKDDA